MATEATASGETMEDVLRELHDLYRRRSGAEKSLCRAELWIAFNIGVLLGAAASLIDKLIRGSL